jgi:hypothetical protein
MFVQSSFISLVRDRSVVFGGSVVDARLVNGCLAGLQIPESQLSLQSSWLPDTEPDANEPEAYFATALAVKRAGRSVRTAGTLSSRTGQGEGLRHSAVVTSELVSPIPTTSDGKTFSRCRSGWRRNARMMAMNHRPSNGRPAGRTPPASIRGRDS